MIPKSGHRFLEKIMRKKAKARGVSLATPRAEKLIPVSWKHEKAPESCFNAFFNANRHPLRLKML
jgi:hypothetical protein